MTKTILSEPAKHSLIECLSELKFGRPRDSQILLDKFIDELKSMGDGNSADCPYPIPEENHNA